MPGTHAVHQRRRLQAVVRCMLLLGTILRLRQHADHDDENSQYQDDYKTIPETSERG